MGLVLPSLGAAGAALSRCKWEIQIWGHKWGPQTEFAHVKLPEMMEYDPNREARKADPRTALSVLHMPSLPVPPRKVPSIQMHHKGSGNDLSTKTLNPTPCLLHAQDMSLPLSLETAAGSHVDPIPTTEDMRAVPLRALTRASRVHTITLPLKQSGPTNLLLGIALSSISSQP